MTLRACARIAGTASSPTGDSGPPETEPDAPGQLFNLEADPGETKNLYFEEATKRQELQALLKQLKQQGRSAPKGRIPIGLENIPRLN